MQWFTDFVDRLSDWLAWLSAVALGLMTVLILLEITLWNTFKVTTLVADEYSAYGLAAIIFLGAGYTLKEGGHIKINLVVNLLPPRLRALVTTLATAVSTAFMAYLCWYLGRMVAATHRYASTSGTLTNTPLWIPQAIMLFGALVFCLQLLAETVKAARGLTGGRPVAAGEEAGR